jgi:hypothetical protein
MNDNREAIVLIIKALSRLLLRQGSYFGNIDRPLADDLSKKAAEIEEELDRQERIMRATREVRGGDD